MQLQQIQTIHHDAELGEIPEDAPFVSPARTPFVSHELIDEWRLYGDYIYIYHRFRNAVALRDVLAALCALRSAGQATVETKIQCKAKLTEHSLGLMVKCLLGPGLTGMILPQPSQIARRHQDILLRICKPNC